MRELYSVSRLGERQDGMSNALFAFILHQAMLDSTPYSPVLHDLSFSPRNQRPALQLSIPLGSFSCHYSETFTKKGKS